MGTTEPMVQGVRALFVAVVSALVSAVACGSPLDAAGVGCGADADCAAGLSCLPLVSGSGAGCKTIANVCSKPCRTDGDCAAVAAGFKCFDTCDGKGTCSQTR